MNTTWNDVEKAVAEDVMGSSTGAVRNLMDDPVNHPSYYTDTKIEVLDYILDHKLGFLLGNCIKYISRAGKKYPGNKEKEIEDLKKARFYLDRRIEQLEDEQKESGGQRA